MPAGGLWQARPCSLSSLLVFLSPSVCPSIPQIPEHLPRDMHCWPWDFWGGQDGHAAAHVELMKPWGPLLLTSDAGRHRELWQDTAGRCAGHQRESLRQAWGQWESTGVSGAGFETRRERGSWLNKGECRQDLRSSVPKVTWLALFRTPYGSGLRA